jgi:hypothetical protein
LWRDPLENVQVRHMLPRVHLRLGAERVRSDANFRLPIDEK